MDFPLKRSIFGRFAALGFLCWSGVAHAELSSLPSLWSQEFQDQDGAEVYRPRGVPHRGIRWEGSVPKAENGDRFFSLASVKKIITAATALRELGAEFRFTNQFTGSMNGEGGVLYQPRFYVSGDPTWAHPSYGETLTSRIEKVIVVLKEKQISKIEGPIEIYSLNAKVDQFQRPSQWKEKWKTVCYAGLPTPVTLQGNCAELTVFSSKKIKWKTPGVLTTIINKTHASQRNSVSIQAQLDKNGRVTAYIFTGGVASPSSHFLPNQNNEAWLKALFVQELKRADISYEEKVGGAGSIEVSVDLSSKPLKEILIPFMQDSINIVGDRLHIEAPHDHETLMSLGMDSVTVQSIPLVDGSGLIAENKITPNLMFQVLQELPKQTYFENLYLGLPVSGVSGTLKSRMNDALLKNKIHAKTGTIDSVSNLAGYWLTNDLRLMPFLVFMESSDSAPTQRAKIDSLVREFARKN